MDEARPLLPRLLKGAAVYAAALFVAFMVYGFWFNFSINNISVVELMFSDLHTIRNVRPYSHWSPTGEFILFVMNPGFVVGLFVGCFQVRSFKDLWKGPMPLLVALVGFCLVAIGVPGSALGVYAAAGQVFIFIVPAIIGSFVGWMAWKTFQLERLRKRT